MSDISNWQDLLGALAPMLSSYMDAQAMSGVVASTFALHEERLLAAAGLDVHAGKDMIVNIPNIILAFAGRVRSPRAGEVGRRQC